MPVEIVVQKTNTNQIRVASLTLYRNRKNVTGLGQLPTFHGFDLDTCIGLTQECCKVVVFRGFCFPWL